MELKMWEISEGFLRQNASTVLSEEEEIKISGLTKLLKGGPGSGNYGHAGIPGHLGGSSSEGGAAAEGSKKEINPNFMSGYSAQTVVEKDGSVRTSNVEDAAKALFEGKKVVLNQPREVSILLDKLAAVAREAESKGEKAPIFNLCGISVAGTNLFCAESKGIPRVQMPQLKGEAAEGSKASALPRDERGETDITNSFIQSLQERGVKLEKTEEQANFLKATQNELNGVKVAGIAKAIREGKLTRESIVVSKDNYIVDGHHRWASTVAVDYDDNHPGDLKMPIIRVDMDIIDLLKESKNFAKDWGIPQQDVSKAICTDCQTISKGGHGSGNFGHMGREGLVGGSTSTVQEVELNDKEREDYAKLMPSARKDYMSHRSAGMDHDVAIRLSEPDEKEMKGYQAGSGGIGADTTLSRMTGGRDTGHFGTGIYFFSNREKAKAYAEPDNRGVTVHNISTGEVSKNPVGDKRPVTEIDLTGANMFRPGTENHASNLHDNLKSVNELAWKKEYNEEQVLETKAWLSRMGGIDVSKDRFIEHVKDARADVDRVISGQNPKNNESLSTRIMREAGYDGIDVRHLPEFDNSSYGSVLYTKKTSKMLKNGQNAYADGGVAGSTVRETHPELDGKCPKCYGEVKESVCQACGIRMFNKAKENLVAVDYHGTIRGHDGKLLSGIREKLQEFRSKGYHIVIWTAGINKNPSIMTGIHTFLEAHEVPYDEVWARQGKPDADVYIDDKSFNPTKENIKDLEV